MSSEKRSKIIDAIESIKDKSPNNLSSFLNKKFKNSAIAIYGAGGFGKEIATVFFNHNIKPIAFLDIQQKDKLFNIPIFHPENFEDKNVTVILSIVLNKRNRNKVIEFLKNLGYKNIVDAQQIRAVYIDLEYPHTYDYFIKNQQLILKPLDFLDDEESKETYTKNISAHITKNYEHTEESDEVEQYFIKGLGLQKNFKSFIDCGAYTGDTYLKLIEINPSLQEYIGFEPMIEAFEQLSYHTSSHKIKSTVFPLAVANKTEFITFENRLGSSKINSEGNVQVMCTKLDNVLLNHQPDFIKMDIEGAEIRALHGAKKLISHSKPNLAICVYHYINHFWEIPNLLHSWNLGYKLYLRTHSSACMETVLYAVKGQEE